jgi:phage terminase small subunit
LRTENDNLTTFQPFTDHQGKQPQSSATDLAVTINLASAFFDGGGSSMKGRPSIPPKLKLLRGNPGKRRVTESGELSGIPELPFEMPPAVMDFWDRLAEPLAASGRLSPSQGLSFAILCRAAADYAIYCQKVAPGNDTSKPGKDKRGRKRNGGGWNIAASARDKAEARLLTMLREFGLTPLSALKVPQSQPAEKDELEEFLSKPRVR